MYKKFTVLLIVVFFTSIAYAQTDSIKLRSVFIELGGIAGQYSINYDKIVYTKNNDGLILGVGFAPTLLIEFDFSPRIPIQAKWFRKINKHIIEAGIGIVPYVYYDTNISFGRNLKDTELAILGQIGYKYLLPNRDLYLGIAFTPLIFDQGFDLFPWGALRFGRRF